MKGSHRPPLYGRKPSIYTIDSTKQSFRETLITVSIAFITFIGLYFSGKSQYSLPVITKPGAPRSSSSVSTTKFVRQPRPQQLQLPKINEDMKYFVKVRDGRFVVGPDCAPRPLYLAGFNSWELMESGAGALSLYGASLPDKTTGPQLVRTVLDRAAANSMNLIRTWAHTVSPKYALETSPGQYSEVAFSGLDYLLVEARKRGIRVLLVLIDNWSEVGGVDEMVKWAGRREHEDFFTDDGLKDMYKQRVAAVVGRVNSMTGVAYKDDTTIFGYNLINEPRVYKREGALKLWIDEMAAYVKSIDSNHLLTVGEEGFYPRNVPQSAANPQGLNSWAFDEGQHPVLDHNSPHIDFVSIHIWCQSWLAPEPSFIQMWLSQHAEDARQLGKPLLIEEYGVFGYDEEYIAARDDYYGYILGLAEHDIVNGAASIQGALFWQFFGEGQRAPEEEGGERGGIFGVFESDSTFQLARIFAQNMKNLTDSSTSLFIDNQSCSTRATSGTDSANNINDVYKCSRLRRSGYEGADCSVDINECIRGTHDCHYAAGCVNTIGSYRCSCYQGYQGDGHSCVPIHTATATTIPAARGGVLEGDYYTAGIGYLACDQGGDIAFKEGSPGFAYNPFDADSYIDIIDGSSSGGGALKKKGIVGSQVPLTAAECMSACEESEGCNSFSYNEELKKCFLKTGSDAGNLCRTSEIPCVNSRGQIYSCGTWQSYFSRKKAMGGGGDGGGGGATVMKGREKLVGNPAFGKLHHAFGISKNN